MWREFCKEKSEKYEKLVVLNSILFTWKYVENVLKKFLDNI